MMRSLLLLACVFASGPTFAEIVVPARTIRAGEVISASDLTWKQIEQPGVVENMDAILGLEARVALYVGRPIRFEDLGPPAVIDRNQLVTLVFVQGALAIATEGRALGRGAEGDRIRVMNLTSRATVTGRVNPDGTVSVP